MRTIRNATGDGTRKKKKIVKLFIQALTFPSPHPLLNYPQGMFLSGVQALNVDMVHAQGVNPVLLTFPCSGRAPEGFLSPAQPGCIAPGCCFQG